MPDSQQSFEREVLDRLILIESKLDGYSDLNRAVTSQDKRIALLEETNDTLETRVHMLEENNKWLVRTMVVAILGVVTDIISRIAYAH